jgi:2-isopropylmalate synthase
MPNRDIRIYDTTLRDGTQGEGISFSVADKLLIAQRLDQFGVDYIEGGFPGSNPRDITFFAEAKNLKLKHAKLAAFGSTRRAGSKADSDPQLRTLLDSEMPVLTIVGKTWRCTSPRSSDDARGEPRDDRGLRALPVAQGREVIYDAEHFFDGYKDDPDYALRRSRRRCAAARQPHALRHQRRHAGRRGPRTSWREVVKRFGAELVGVHCHNDSGLGRRRHARRGRGGRHARPGHDERLRRARRQREPDDHPAQPVSLKMGTHRLLPRTWRSSGTSRSSSTSWRTCGPTRRRPSSAQSAFAHKGGLHANAAQKVARSYEHIDPALVGNRTRVLVSDMAGRSSLALKARELGLELDEKRPEMKGLIEELKEREFRGYEYEAADASFKLLVAKAWLGQRREFFEVEGYRVIVERHGGELWAEATVKVKVNGESIHTVAEEPARSARWTRPCAWRSKRPIRSCAR